MKNNVRVAAVQFATGTNVAENLQTCLRMIDQAAECKPDILVLPEFCNHSSWYQDQAYAYQVAVEIGDAFTSAIGQKASKHQCYIMLNCTVRREEPSVTGTNILFAPDGQIVAVSDKQVLMGNENNFLSRADSVCPIIETDLGRLAMYSCMDGVIYETPRGLGLRGAQILLNSLNSFADDEASLHIPVRAAENKVFVVAANKIGSLVPEELASVIADRVKINPEQLHGAGESQIVAPDGTVLARAPRQGEAFIYADIDPRLADHKLRPDGTDIMASRRPELYQPLSQAPVERIYNKGVDECIAAVYEPKFKNSAAVSEVIDLLPQLSDTAILVLPELFHIEDPRHLDAATAHLDSEAMILSLSHALKQLASPLMIATSVVSANGSAYGLSAVLISADGLMLSQEQLHPSASYKTWAHTLGSEIKVIDTIIGRVALMLASDSIYPELFRLLALQNVEVVLLPTHFQEAWELQTGLIERAAENRMNIVAASRANAVGSSLILALDEDFTLWTEWKNRPFDGNINYPIVHKLPAAVQLLKAPIYPACAANRMVSQKTDVVDGRPYWLLDAITGHLP